jgi:cytochrome c-type biogenesis protein CcmF
MDAAAVGIIAVWGALGICCVTVAFSLFGGPKASRRSSHALFAVAGLAAVAVGALGWALFTLDFSLVYVAETTTRVTPWPYRLSAIWGAMEGSLLWWSALLAILGAIGVRSARLATPSLAPVMAATVAVVVGAFLVVGLTLASPFTKLSIPAIDGGGLVPILEHPAMVYHPPILYIGLTSLLVPFALTIAALATSSVDVDWLALARRWLLFSWTALVFGMALGSNWAYVELGWGGFWAWDSVENTALLPWLAATAFLHSTVVQRRTGRLSAWNSAFGILPFVLVLLGAYLTRSGVTQSVHGFAESRVIGRVLLGFLVAAIIGSVIVLIRRAAPSGGWRLDTTRERFLALNAVLLVFAIVVVALGSTYPAISLWVSSMSVSVATRWYVVMLLPVTIVAAVAMSIALGRNRRDVTRSALVFAVSATATLVIALVLGVRSPYPLGLLAVSGGAAVSLVRQVFVRRRRLRQLPAALAHLGFVVLLFGAAGSALGSDFVGGLGEGDEATVGGYTLLVNTIEVGATDRFDFIRADVSVRRGDRAVGDVAPELRAYTGALLPTPEPALLTSPVDDIIVGVFGTSDDASVLRFSVFVRPLVMWVWIGAILVGLSGVLGLAFEVGFGARRHPTATGEQRGEGTTTDMSSHANPSQDPRGQTPVEP